VSLMGGRALHEVQHKADGSSWRDASFNSKIRSQSQPLLQTGLNDRHLFLGKHS
jgi:hypothetical protein